LLFSLFSGHDSGLCTANTPNSEFLFDSIWSFIYSGHLSILDT